MSSTVNKKDFQDVEMAALMGQAQSSMPMGGKGSSNSLAGPSSSSTMKDVQNVDIKSSSDNNSLSSEDEKKRYKGIAGKSFSACMMYSSCSVGMVLVNKSLASSYNHLIDGSLNILLVVFQAITAVIAVEFCKKMNWVEYPPFNMRTAMKWAPVNILFCLMLFTGMASLQHNNVPMVTVFKNVTNIFITAGDVYFFKSPVEKMAMLAFGIMLGGAIAAAWYDLYITGAGLFWMVANCLATSGYVLYLKFATKTLKLSKFGMVFYNNVLCSLFLLPVASAMGEVRIFLSTPAIHTLDYFLKNVFAGFVGFFLNFASLNCVQITGPTTYAIVGSLNKIPITFFGWLMFSSTITPQTWFFIAISMFGGFLYSYAKISEGRKKAAQASSS